MHIRKVIMAAPVSLAVLGWIVTGLAQSKTPATSPAPKTAVEVYKNIQVLKDAPAEQLILAMQFISGALGVGCDHCHVRGAFEKDDKLPKQTARKMMLMMIAINQNNFDGHREVTCYSCHHGEAHPVSVPAVAEENAAPATAAAAESISTDLPNADKLVEKYLQALGNANDLHKLSSRVEKGKAVILPGREFPSETTYKTPDKAASTIHLPDGDMITGHNEHGGWLLTPGRPTHDLSYAELDAAGLDSTFYFPLHVKELFSEIKTTGTEKVGGHAVYVVTGKREKQPPMRLYFDQESGLLLRLLRYDETPVGRIPVQTDLSDYQDVSGIKVPYMRTTARPSRRMSIRIEQVEQNTTIDDSKFEKPAAATAPEQPTAPK